MTAKGSMAGHPIWWDVDTEQWRLTANNEPYGDRQNCTQCGQECVIGQPDPCLGHIPGAIGACCGHGVEVGSIFWPEVVI